MAKDRAGDKAIGKAVKELRAEAVGPAGGKMTQDDLAEAIGLRGKGRAVTVSRIETGAIPITAKRLESLARALAVPASEIELRAEAIRLRSIDKKSEAQAADAGIAGGIARGLLTVMAGSRAADNAERRRALEAKVAQRQRTTQDLFEPLRQAQVDVIDDVLVPLIDCANTIQRNDPLPPAVGESLDDFTLEQRLHLHKEQTAYQVANTLGTTALGAGAGALAGAGAATAVMSLVAASATASTGVAIGSLSGAAATSATLAWLGGGSLAAGGLGVAGGTLVLASIVALPAAIAGAGVLAYQGHKMREQARSESMQLDLAEASLDETDERLQRAWAWMRTERRLLAQLRKAGVKRLNLLQSDLAALPSPIILKDMDDAFQENFRCLSDITAVCVSILGLSIFAELDSEPNEFEDPDVRRAWIDLVLADAQNEAERLRPDTGHPVEWPSKK